MTIKDEDADSEGKYDREVTAEEISTVFHKTHSNVATLANTTTPFPYFA